MHAPVFNATAPPAYTGTEYYNTGHGVEAGQHSSVINGDMSGGNNAEDLLGGEDLDNAEESMNNNVGGDFVGKPAGFYSQFANSTGASDDEITVDNSGDGDDSIEGSVDGDDLTEGNGDGDGDGDDLTEDSGDGDDSIDGDGDGDGDDFVEGSGDGDDFLVMEGDGGGDDSIEGDGDDFMEGNGDGNDSIEGDGDGDEVSDTFGRAGPGTEIKPLNGTSETNGTVVTTPDPTSAPKTDEYYYGGEDGEDGETFEPTTSPVPEDNGDDGGNGPRFTSSPTPGATYRYRKTLAPTTEAFRDKVKDEEMRIQQLANDRTAEALAFLIAFFGIVGMLLTAYFLFEYPDGLCASCCRLSLRFSSFLLKIFLLPCRLCCGKYAGYTPSDPKNRTLFVEEYTNDLELT